MSKYKLVLPVDTLIRDCYGRLSHIKCVTDRFAMVYYDGTSSNTEVVGGTFQSTIDKGLDVQKNKPQPWFGGECPVSDGVKIKIWFRCGGCSNPISGSLRWRHEKLEGDIIAYQILDQILTFEKDAEGNIVGFNSELVEGV